MKIDRIELRNKLAALRPGLAKKELAQQACHFVFLEHEIVTFNDKICIMIPFESEAEFSVKGEEFFRLVDGMTDDAFDLVVNNNKVVIKSKTTSAKMATISEEGNVIPAVVAELKAKMTKWKTLPKTFTEGRSLCSFSTSSDLTRGVLSAVAIVGDACYSLDSNRSSYFKMDSPIVTPISVKEIFISGKDAVELVKFPVSEYCTDGKWMHFRTEEGATFSCQLMFGKFPIGEMIPVYAEKRELPHMELPKELKAVVDNATVLASDDYVRTGKAVRLSICNKEITVEATNDLGGVEKTVPCDYDGDEICLDINSRLLSQILDRATSFRRDGEMLHFLSGPFQHILMAIPNRGE